MNYWACVVADDSNQIWNRLLTGLSQPNTHWHADELMVEGPMEEGLYTPQELLTALAAQTMVQEARILLLPEEVHQPENYDTFEAFSQGPALAAIYMYDCRVFEVFAENQAFLSSLAELPGMSSFFLEKAAESGRNRF